MPLLELRLGWFLTIMFTSPPADITLQKRAVDSPRDKITNGFVRVSLSVPIRKIDAANLQPFGDGAGYCSVWCCDFVSRFGEA